MAFRSLLPRGIGTNRRGFENFINDLADRYEQAFEEAYVKEAETIILDIIDHTPIATGAAAGTLSNSVGDAHKPLKWNHHAKNLTIGNEPGDSGWQMDVDQTGKVLKIAIFNPMWEHYLRYLNAGLVNLVDHRAEPHWVDHAWHRHLARRAEISKEIKDNV